MAAQLMGALLVWDALVNKGAADMRDLASDAVTATDTLIKELKK